MKKWIVTVITILLMGAIPIAVIFADRQFAFSKEEQIIVVLTAVLMDVLLFAVLYSIDQFNKW